MTATAATTTPGLTGHARVNPIGDRELKVERVFQASRARLWKALTDPQQLAQWWGRGHELVVEKHDFVKGGHWRFVEHTDDGGAHGFEGRFADIEPETRVVQTFEWDGMPGHVSKETMTLEDLGDGRTKMTTHSIFMTAADRDGMMSSGMEGGMNESYAALDALLARAH